MIDPTDVAALSFAPLPEMVAAHASRRPRHAALICDARSVDYGALDAEADRVAAALQLDGVRHGDTVAICASNSIEYGIVFLAALRAGAAVAPLPQSTAPPALALMIADTGARHVFVDAGVEALLEPLRATLAPRVVRLESMHDWLESAPAKPQPVAVDPEDAFNIIYSSGTTGAPKGIVQPHRMRWGHVQRAPRYGYGPDAITLISTPLLLEHDAGGFPSHAGARRDGRADAEVRRGRLPGARTAPSRHARDAGAGAVPAPHGAARISSASTCPPSAMKFCTSAPFAAALKARRPRSAGRAV